MATHYLIVANGGIDFHTAEAISTLANGRVVIALDGAANFLMAIGAVPHMCMGDCDSLSLETEALLRSRGVEIIKNQCQNTTDLEKAIIHIGKVGDCASATIIHALGGRQDHALGNISFLKKYGKLVGGLSILSWQNKTFYAEDCTLTISGEPGRSCGFFGFPMATVTSRGLRYEMLNHRLELGASESVANSFAGDEVNLEISGQCIVTHGV
ncbi:MAG: thiamine diphosphokinase [Puniceicoccales bacterium]|jgi:thiamine pyrophosphokinase|nr:thiamine diphosphokinase [Puniceicoccales bacterium]